MVCLNNFPDNIQENIVILDNKTKIDLLKFPALSLMKFVEHVICTRQGGVSKVPFDSLNVSLNVGDNFDCVQKNRSTLNKLSGGEGNLYLKQNHGTRVLVIAKKLDLLKGLSSGCFADAVVTNIPGINLIIQTADCQSVFIVDPVKKVIANVHVGWRGSVGRILEKTIAKMVKCFDCVPTDIVATIGPSLGPCCAEFTNFKKELPKSFSKYKIGISNFDFWEISKQQISKSGVPSDSIHSSNLCTKCNSHLFFSYRKNKITGRFPALIRILG